MGCPALCVASPPARPIERAGGFPACHHGRNEQAPRLRESPRLLRGHHHTSLEAPTPRCNASPASCGPPGCASVLAISIMPACGHRPRRALPISISIANAAIVSVQAWPVLHHQHRHGSVR
jgi:hypothetical protein